MDDDRARFTELYDACRTRVWAYAASRVGTQAADEVVSETFMVAWRRFDEIPPASLPWLLGVARNVIRHSVRVETRRASLAAELRAWTETAESDPAEAVVDRMTMLRALASLSDADREVLTLIAWHGLDPREAARVIGCTTAALRVRLHRARRRLAAAVNTPAATRRPRGARTIEMEWS